VASLGAWLLGAGSVAAVAGSIIDPEAPAEVAGAAATGATILAGIGIQADRNTFWGQVSKATGFSPDSIFIGIILLVLLVALVVRRK